MTATPIGLALTSAVSYGTGDFLGGQGSRRTSPEQLSLIVQVVGLFVALVAAAITVRGWPPAHVVAWGALAGVGSAVGNKSLYRGLATGAMNVVAPLSAVLTAALPALVGLADGERLGLLGGAGLLIAGPAIALISMTPAPGSPQDPWVGDHRRAGAHRGGAGQSVRRGVGWGLSAGCGFGLLFVGLDKAGTGSGAWPLLLDQIVAVILVGGVHSAARRRVATTTRRAPWSQALRWGVSSGLCGAAGNICFFLATASGPLTVVAVLSALYPAVTVILAAVVLHERAGAAQLAGLLLAAFAVALITGA